MNSSNSGAKTNRSSWAWIAAGFVIGALIAVPFFRSGPSRAAGPAGLAGTAAPVFSLRDDRGAAVSLSGYRGKVVVVNLWASWCPPCRAEMPDLQRIADAYASRGVVVVGINEGESQDRARAFAGSLRIAFPIWLDDSQRYGRAFTAQGMPTTVIVGRDGKVLQGFDGPLTFAALSDVLRASLGS